MSGLHVKKGDRVKVIAGKDKGKEGEILKVTGFYNMIQSALVGLLGILLINVLHLGL